MSVDAQIRETAIAVLSGESKGRGWNRIAPFLGPAFIASIAYVDPGNFATNIEGGARFGYRLLWVIVASNLMAFLVQSLSAKLGIATGHSLAHLCRLRLSHTAAVGLWVVMELVAVATDLAEFLGACLGFSLLLGIPLAWGGALAAVTVTALLLLERCGFRPLEMAIGGLLLVVALSYCVETLLDNPSWHVLARNALVPGFAGPESVVLAAGILGATVMPHAIFLHSGLTYHRVRPTDARHLRRLYHFELLDCGLAMGVAGLVNAAMLVMSASTFNRAGLTAVATIEHAYRTLTPLLGPFSGRVFAISLLASGLSSTVVGNLSAQKAMQGLTGRSVPLLVRRLLTFVPTAIVLACGASPTQVLVMSQVVLSFALPLALIPLVRFTADRSVMGPLANGMVTTCTAWAVTAVVLSLNCYLIARIVM